MPSQIWTLTSGATEQTLAAWGIDRAVVTRKSQDSDTLEISVPNAAFDADVLFAFESSVTLQRYPGVDVNGNPTGTPVVWFVGICTRTPRTGRPSAEGMDYTFEGPWYWLANVVYQQNWTLFNGSSQVTGPQSRVNLFTLITGALMTTAVQITDAITWATGSGAVLQGGSLPTGIYVPTEQGVDLTCAEVIKRALRWHPDALTWFDYTTSPPTLNIALRSTMTSLNLAIPGPPAEQIDIVARNDLVHPVVVLKYSQTNVVNGQQALSLLTEQYPTDANPLQPRALILSVDLAGSRSSYLTQAITAPALDETNPTWWAARLAELNDSTVSELTYHSGTAARTPINDGDTVYDNELLEGAIADWMTNHTTEAVISAQVSYKQTTTDGGGNTVTHVITNRTVSVRVMTTDATTNTYQSIGTDIPADPKPTGLAENYYNALAQLQYEGSFAIVEQDIGSTQTPPAAPFSGMVLNLTGSRSEWTSMNAGVHTITEDLNSGRTTLKFGPHAYLSPQDLVAHLRATRTRVIPELEERAGGVSSGGPQELPGVHKKQAPGKVETTPDLTIPYNEGANILTVRPTDISGAGSLPNTNLTLKPMVIQVCTADGYVNMLVLGSATWTP